jgi:diacylglycerol kinase (ATP)
MNVTLIANPSAGSGQAHTFLLRASELLTDHGVTVHPHLPPDREGTREATRLAISAQHDAVVAIGGDGTVHDVLQSLVGTQIALGVIPAGSGDDVASGLGLITDSPDASTRAIVSDLLNGTRHRVNVGHAITADGTSRYFGSVLCTGFDAHVNSRANTMPRLWGQRYTVAMIRELLTFRPLSYRLTCDGRLSEYTAMIVSVANGPRYGGGMRICPDADPTDGLLDVVILSQVSRLRLLWSFRLVFSGSHVRLPFVHVSRANDLVIDSAGQYAFADGERLGALPVSVRTSDTALLLVGSDGSAGSGP